MTKGTNRLPLANVDISGDTLKFRTDVIPKSSIYQGSLSDKKKQTNKKQTGKKGESNHAQRKPSSSKCHLRNIEKLLPSSSIFLCHYIKIILI